MVTYNPKDWFKLIFHFHKSDTFRVLLPTMFVLGLLTAAVCYAESTYFENTYSQLTIFHQISGFVISLVLVFRINTAYDRWWEGRKLWGALVNTTRNLAIKLNAMLANGAREERSLLHGLISNYPFALKEHLRNNVTDKGIVFSSLLSQNNYLKVEHKPNYLATILHKHCLDLSKNNVHTPNDFLILNENLNQLTDICGACERIKTTPIPYSYSIFIKKMIFIYIITMPIAFGLSLGYWAIPIVMIIFYAFASLELISEEIEDPFGTDSNDLPTDEISEKIKKSVYEILLGHDH
ncbi:MAG: bestrophin family ion channel [bacterium]|nr:bestrophin family ion channel [bacterium]